MGSREMHRPIARHDQASQLFSPEASEYDTRPVRVFWDIMSAITAGAAIGALAGNALIGAATGGLSQVARSVPPLLHEFGSPLFGRGAFDLAHRIRTGASQVELGALKRLLSKAERQNLGIT